MEALRLEGCASVSDFEWQRQLRFECDPVSEDIAIHQVSFLTLMSFSHHCKQAQLLGKKGVSLTVSIATTTGFYG